MSDPYKEAKPGRLIFKGGDSASLSKNKNKKKHKKKSTSKSDEIRPDLTAEQSAGDPSGEAAVPAGGEVYTIDAAKKMKYEELFPVEARKFGYDPNNVKKDVKSDVKKRSVEESLDDRVKKKADRYCK